MAKSKRAKRKVEGRDVAPKLTPQGETDDGKPVVPAVKVELRRSYQRAIAQLGHLLAIDTELLQYAAEWEEGFPAGGGGSGRSIGSVTDRTGNEAIRLLEVPREGHGLAAEAIELHNEILTAVAHIRDLSSRARRIEPMAPGVADLKARDADPRSIGAGHCLVEACDTFCSGAKNDAILQGFCPACFDAWKRNGRPDRLVFTKTWVPRDKRNQLRNSEGESAGNPPPPPQESIPSGSTGGSAPPDEQSTPAA